MDKGRVSKFFKVYVNSEAHKVFLEDVCTIYKVNKRKTPPLTPYCESPRQSDERQQMMATEKNESILVASKTYG